MCRVVKGVFEKRPALPKYQETWDVDVVLEFLCTWPTVQTISLKLVTLRLVMLLALLSGQRGQTLHTLKIDDVRLSTDKCVLVYSSVLKQTKPGDHVKPLELEAFNSEPKLCVVTHLYKYLKVTEPLRQGRELFI